MAEIVRKDESAMAATEQTRPEPVFTPAVDIYETENEIVVLADLPGVSADGLNIRLEDNVLTLEGELKVEPAQGLSSLLEEYRSSGRYWRQFTLGEAIDRQKIKANIKNGELKVVLPKAAAARPQKIAVKAG